MLRVINQEEARVDAWGLWSNGAGKKRETFDKYLRRVGVRTVTPMPSENAAADTARTVESVRNRLGALYKPPTIKA